MREPAYPAAPSASTASRRRAVGPKYPGIYASTNRAGDRILECDYYDRGRRRWATLPAGISLKDAVAERARLRTQSADGQAPPAAGSPKLSDVWERWLDSASPSLRPGTVTLYRHAIGSRVVPLIGHRRIADIDRRDVAKLVRDLAAGGEGRKPLAGHTIRGTLGPLRMLMEWAEDEGLRRGNPVRDLRRRERPRTSPKEHRVLTDEDLRALVESASDERRAFVALLAFAGLRLSECLGLTWADVDLDGRVLHVRRQLERGSLTRVAPKTDRATRDVEVADVLLSVLRSWKLRSRFSGPSDFVVTTGAGGPLDHRSAGRRLATVVKAAGLDVEGEPKITPHQCRYSFGALMLDANVPVAVVSRLMGHADEAITQSTYSHEIRRRDQSDRTRAWMTDAFGGGLAAAGGTS